MLPGLVEIKVHNLIARLPDFLYRLAARMASISVIGMEIQLLNLIITTILLTYNLTFGLLLKSTNSGKRLYSNMRRAALRSMYMAKINGTTLDNVVDELNAQSEYNNKGNTTISLMWYMAHCSMSAILVMTLLQRLLFYG